MLSEEEKQAIDKMNKFARVHQDMSVVSAKDMNIVLKLVEKLQKENEEKDKTIEKYIKIYKEYDCYRWVKELEKKDKQVNLMSKYISNLDIDEDICKKVENNCEDFNKENKCIECVKQYFYNEVRGENNG